MTESRKRDRGPGPDRDAKRRARGGRKWQVPRQSKGTTVGTGGAEEHSAREGTIEPGDSGIWATCDKGREGKCVGELRDLFERYASEIYGEVTKVADADGDGDGGADEADDDGEDIESIIQREVRDLKSSRGRHFTPVKLDIPCVVFFKTAPPIVPVDFVRRIVLDAAERRSQVQTRHVKRLTPMTLMGKAFERELELLARTILGPHFHEAGLAPKKFAIRPTIRKHNVLTRDVVIQKVAEVVGPGHSVDLTHYDVLILVEVYKNICGISVVGGDFDVLKRYNLAELSHPTATVHAAPAGQTPPPAEATTNKGSSEPTPTSDRDRGQLA